MDPIPSGRSSPVGVMLSILLAPLAVAFIIAASLSAGPREVFKAIFRPK